MSKNPRNKIWKGEEVEEAVDFCETIYIAGNDSDFQEISGFQWCPPSSQKSTIFAEHQLG